MNFNFRNQPKFGFTQPMVRSFSTFGFLPAKTEADFIYKNVQNNFLNLNHNVFYKSFNNPNFVNKQNPKSLAPSVAGIINFDNGINIAKPNYEDIKPIIKPTFQPQNHHEHKKREENHTINLPEPEKSSSQTIKTLKTTVNSTDMPCDQEDIYNSPKTGRKNRRKGKNRKNVKKYKQDLSEQNKNTKKSLCLLPKKFRNYTNMKCRRKNQKCKPWHKISIGMEIMELDENLVTQTSPNTPMSPDATNFPPIGSKFTPNEPNFPPVGSKFTPNGPNFPPKCPIKEEIYVISQKNQSAPIEIKCNKICDSMVMSISPCADFVKFLSSSSSSTSDISSLSPSSPIIRRLRMPSECESEDSFIVFCDDNNSCVSEDLCEDISSEEEEEYSDSDSDIDVVDFIEKTDLNRDTCKKKVSFKCDSELCEIYPMIKWSYAYKSARKGPWEQLARDRSRFENRIRNTESILSNILSKDHRHKIFKERFENFE